LLLIEILVIITEDILIRSTFLEDQKQMPFDSFLRWSFRESYLIDHLWPIGSLHRAWKQVYCKV